MNLTRLALMLFALVQLAGAGMMDQMLVRDSLRTMPRWEQVRWLAGHGLADPYLRASAQTDSGPIRCIGRWSYGPSTFVEVKATATDTIVFLSRGSGVSIIRFRSSDTPSLALLADINCGALTGRLTVRDSLLFVGSGGLETYDIRDLTHPALLSRWNFAAYDYFIRDTFCYTVNRESLSIYSIADPLSPRFLGACRDSAYVLFVSGGYAYLGDQYGLYIVDVSNPVSPHRVSTIGGDIISETARDSLLFFGTTDQGLKSYDVSDPASPVPLGTLSGIQPAYLYLPPTCDTVLYTPVFHAINITDPSNPRIVGQVSCYGWHYCVTAAPALNYALVADHHEGLVAVDITSPASPRIDTEAFAADMAEDICLDNGRAYVADCFAGLQILDVTTPEAPTFLGRYDTVGTRPDMEAVCAKDSFAYVPFYSRALFRSVCVSDPRRPTLAGVDSTAYDSKDMVLRDSFVYKASMRNFQIVNVARPREPAVVGSCMLPDESGGMSLQDSLAFVPNAPTQVVSVADPAHPVVVAQIDRYAWNVFVKDTLAFFAGGNGLFIYSVADIHSPCLIDSIAWGANVFDVVAVDTLAYVGCRDGLRLLSISDPAEPRLLAFQSAPYLVWRLTYAEPYVYAACSEAGICVFETTQTAIAEPGELRPRAAGVVALTPNPAGAQAALRVAQRSDSRWSIVARDATGRRVDVPTMMDRVGGLMKLDLSLMGSGVYFVEVREGNRSTSVKLVRR